MNISALVLIAVTSITTFFTPARISEIQYLNTPAGSQRLVNAPHQKCYWQLSVFFDTQKEPTYCGVASAIMVLNALGIERPAWREKSAFKLFMQDHFFSPEVEQFVTKEKAAKEGIELCELSKALETFGVDVTAIPGNSLTLNRFRSLLREALNKTDTYMIVNYFRPSVKQTGKGHFSPVAAYDEQSDSVLVMDVARYRYPPAWIPLEMLLDSIQAKDEDSGRERGILIVSKKLLLAL